MHEPRAPGKHTAAFGGWSWARRRDSEGVIRVAATEAYPGAAPSGRGWTPGRIVSVVAGAVLILGALGLRGGGGAALWADTAARDGGGYVNVSSEAYRTSG